MLVMGGIINLRLETAPVCSPVGLETHRIWQPDQGGRLCRLEIKRESSISGTSARKTKTVQRQEFNRNELQIMK